VQGHLRCRHLNYQSKTSNILIYVRSIVLEISMYIIYMCDEKGWQRIAAAAKQAVSRQEDRMWKIQAGRARRLERRTRSKPGAPNI
jgi:hypothetical protein